MKGQNRYAQLVEAQSPEPTVRDDRHSTHQETMSRMQTSSRENSISSERLAMEMKMQGPKPGSRKSSPQQQLEQSLVGAIDANGSVQQDAEWSSTRGVSVESDPLSTSFLSSRTTLSQQSSASSVNNSLCQQVDQRKLHSSISACNKTISRSMLELDKSITGADKFEVSWRELSFSYKSKLPASLSKRRDQLVLRNLSGSFSSNQLVAVIGPSGCGKTTLLQFLAGNKPTARHRLKIVGLDEPKVAFIGQDDCLLPGLSARETLIYASRLQNCDPNFDHQSHVEPILNQLGLAECADRSVTKLSGGQAKRVTIAQELLYPTNLLILDEVTSGLDASTSYSIVKLLKQLVSDESYPMSIVMSIHQPSAKLFSVFDQVCVMSEGSCLYQGSCQVDDVNAYLSHFHLECPKFHNIADYLIEIACSDLSPEDRSTRHQMVQYGSKQGDQNALLTGTNGQEINKKSLELHCEGQDESEVRLHLDEAMLTGGFGLFESIERARGRRERPLYLQFKAHFSRSILRIRRSHILTWLQLVTYILLGLQLATFYGPEIGEMGGCPLLPVSFMTFVFANDSGTDLNLEMRRVQENMNFLLVAIMTATFAALEITVITFPMEAKTVKREWRNGWYRVSSYFLGRTLADLPFQLVFVVVFCLVIYTLTGQIGLTSWRFASFVTIIVMTALIAQTVGFIFGALFMDNLPAAVFTAPLCIFPALLFSGFFSRVSQVPSFYKPMTYLSHYRYAFDALLVTLYGYERCSCDQPTLSSYHESLQNQTSTVRDVFKSLFGTSMECAPNPEENSIEDPPAPARDEAANLSLLNLSNLITTTTTMAPKVTSIKGLEDVLVDSLYEHMKNSNATSGANATEAGGSAMDHLVNRFSHRITSMLNTQSNFGHPVPTSCQNFNPYLMTEFDLHNEDLVFGLVMLFVFVIVARLLCNAILTFTIASRNN